MFWDRVCKQLFFSTVADSQSGVKTTSGHKMHRVSGTDFQNDKYILKMYLIQAYVILIQFWLLKANKVCKG